MSNEVGQLSSELSKWTSFNRSNKNVSYGLHPPNVSGAVFVTELDFQVWAMHHYRVAGVCVLHDNKSIQEYRLMKLCQCGFSCSNAEMGMHTVVVCGA